MTFKYEETLCPDCGGQMVSRSGTYGTFWGCKAFPKCRGTRDSQGRSKADRAAEKGENYEHDEKDITNKFSFKKTI
jgi:DNA topoisomerase-1